MFFQRDNFANCVPDIHLVGVLVSGVGHLNHVRVRNLAREGTDDREASDLDVETQRRAAHDLVVGSVAVHVGLEVERVDKLA